METINLYEDDVPGAKLSKQPSDTSVMELKRWLKCRGLKLSGSKPILVTRVQNGMKMNLPIDIKVDEGKWYELKREKSRESQLSLTSFPPPTPFQPQTNATTTTTTTSTTTTTVTTTVKRTNTNQNSTHNLQLKVFPSVNIPSSFNEGIIYHYLVEQANKVVLEEDETYDDGTTAKPLKKGEMLHKSCFVENVGDTEDENLYHIQAYVHHSMKSEAPLLTRVSLSKRSSFVSKCSCTCVSKKLERCCHIAGSKGSKCRKNEHFYHYHANHSIE